MMGAMTEISTAVDDIDREILRILRDDARIPWQALGARVHMSPNAAADRVRRLIRSGAIRRFTLDVDHEALGRSLDAIIEVKVEDATKFRDGALGCDEVTGLINLTGRDDFQVGVSCAGTAGLNALLGRFRDEFGMTESHTRLVLERYR
jgi:Lrp/AsnC family transcriptional regulator, leucine-responsive regulatory protein